MAIKAAAAKGTKRKTTASVPKPGALSLSQQVSELRDRLNDALIAKGFFKKAKKDTFCNQWIEDMYDSTVIFFTDEGLFSATYTDKSGSITLGKKVPVERRVVYVPKA